MLLCLPCWHGLFGLENSKIPVSFHKAYKMWGVGLIRSVQIDAASVKSGLPVFSSGAPASGTLPSRTVNANIDWSGCRLAPVALLQMSHATDAFLWKLAVRLKIW